MPQARIWSAIRHIQTHPIAAAIADGRFLPIRRRMPSEVCSSRSDAGLRCNLVEAPQAQDPDGLEGLARYCEEGKRRARCARWPRAEHFIGVVAGFSHLCGHHLELCLVVELIGVRLFQGRVVLVVLLAVELLGVGEEDGASGRRRAPAAWLARRVATAAAKQAEEGLPVRLGK